MSDELLKIAAKLAGKAWGGRWVAVDATKASDGAVAPDKVDQSEVG